MNSLIALVASVWAFTVFWGMIRPNYTPPPTVHLAFMAIVGALFGKSISGRIYQKGKDDEPPK